METPFPQRYNFTVPGDGESAGVALSELTQKALLDELFARVPEAIVLLDSDNRVLQINPEFTRIFGYSQQEAQTRFIKELVVPEEFWAESEECRHRRVRGEILRIETVRRRKDGARISVSMVGVSVSIAGSPVSEYVIYRDITERKRAEQALQQSQFYLSEGQRLARMGSWTFNPSGLFEYWSEELYKIYGMDPAKGAPTLEEYLATVHPEDREFMANTIKRMHAEHCGCDVTKRIVRPGGEERYIRCVGIPFVEGEVLKGFLGTAMDVTEQELLTHEAERREAYLAEAQRLSQTGSWAWNPASGDIRYWSEECYRVLGFDPAGPLPRFETFFQRIHPDDQARIRQLFEQAIRDKADFEFGYRIVHPSKGIRDIHVIGHAVLDRSGDLADFLGTVVDITERKRAEQELKQIVDLVPQFIVVLEPDGRCTYANRVAREYSGLTLEDFRFPDVFGRLVHRDDLKKLRPARARGLAGTAPFELDGRMRGHDGTYRWFLMRYNPLIEEGEVCRWYVSATEIESLKQEEVRMLQENVRLEERTRIARELHDTLLQTVQGASFHLTAALYEVPHDSAVKPRLERILELMLQGVAEGRNAIQGMRSTESQDSDLVVALSRIPEELKVAGIDFRVSVNGPRRPCPPQVQNEIYRIGREALVNAFRHSAAKRVELELEYSDIELHIRIRDNGRGIDPQTLEKGKDGHWGLGGMRERAKRIGGRVTISSTPTAGTEVQISIPCNFASDTPVPQIANRKAG